MKLEFVDAFDLEKGIVALLKSQDPLQEEIKSGDSVYVSFYEDSLQQKMIFVKISALGYRVVRSLEAGSTPFALEDRDHMVKS